MFVQYHSEADKEEFTRVAEFLESRKKILTMLLKVLFVISLAVGSELECTIGDY